MQNGHTLFSQSYATYLGIKLDELNRLYPEKESWQFLVFAYDIQ